MDIRVSFGGGGGGGKPWDPPPPPPKKKLTIIVTVDREISLLKYNDNAVRGRLSENYLTRKFIARNICDAKYSRFTVINSHNGLKLQS